MQSENQSLWFRLAGFDLFIHSVRATVCERLSLHVVQLKKRGKRYFLQPHRTTTRGQLIWDLWAGQNRNLILSFCSRSLQRLNPRKFGSVQFSAVRLPPAGVSDPTQSETVSVSVFLTLSSTASHSCPSPRSTPGSCRHTGSSRWSHDCCGHCRDGSEPGVLKKKNKNTKFDNLLNVSRILLAGCVFCV